MSDRRTYNKGVAGTYLKKGSWNAWCMRCGRKFKADQLTKEWDELWICQTCFEDRHPQDMVRGQVDEQRTPWASPEVADTFVLNATITGLTQATFATGPEETFDDINTLTVQVSGGLLSSVQQLDVLNGANLAAVMNPDGDWEVIQFTTATAVSPAVYRLSHLLRARRGTELAMYAANPLPVGSPFVFIGQSDASNEIWLQTYLALNNMAFSPVDITAGLVGQDIVFGWARRTKVIRLDQDDLDTGNTCPLGEIDERYGVDVLSTAGAVLRTLHAVGTPQATYPAADQIADFGAIQANYTVNVYQISNDNPTQPRGHYRQFTTP